MASGRPLGRPDLRSLVGPRSRHRPRALGHGATQARARRGVRRPGGARVSGCGERGGRHRALVWLRRDRRDPPGIRVRPTRLAARLAHGHGWGRPRRGRNGTALPVTPAIAIDLDGALGDTRALWDDFLADASRRFASIASLDPTQLSQDRCTAAAELDRWAAHGIGDWRGALERFAEDRAPVFLRPDAEASAALRALSAAGARLGVFTDAPEPLARVALSHLGATRRVEAVEAGAGALERLLARFGEDTVIVSSRDDLVKISLDAGSQPSG